MKILHSAAMPQGKRLNIYFTDEEDLELYDSVSLEAKMEKRSMSQMVKILASEALANRRKKSQKSKEEEE
ncbi:MAG TPA: hypothetical protein VK184_17075 [Nostocaceae cyanobacterium]|nr:hypothetical protein [Nostocaceae cyanobacterium]